jgi:hypothetical protein
VNGDILGDWALLLLRNEGSLVASSHRNTVATVGFHVRWLGVGWNQTHCFGRLLL